MNTVVDRPIILEGPNAGRPRPYNTIVLDRLTATKAALITLIRCGFSLVREPELGGIAPTLTIENCARCADLGGITVKWAHDQTGTYRVVEAKLDQVRVRWIERGH